MLTMKTPWTLSGKTCKATHPRIKADTKQPPGTTRVYLDLTHEQLVVARQLQEFNKCKTVQEAIIQKLMS